MSYRTTGIHEKHAKDDDMFLSLAGVLYVIVNSRKKNGKELKHSILSMISFQQVLTIKSRNIKKLSKSNIQL